jgi:hypothetical protein
VSHSRTRAQVVQNLLEVLEGSAEIFLRSEIAEEDQEILQYPDLLGELQEQQRAVLREALHDVLAQRSRLADLDLEKGARLSEWASLAEVIVVAVRVLIDLDGLARARETGPVDPAS